jgi:ABC-2 type transport system permease protein
MSAELIRRDVFDRRRSIAAWSLAYIAFLVMIMATYESVAKASGLQSAIEEYPDALLALFGGADVNITTVPGYLDSQLYAFMLPIMILVFAIGYGAQAVAGEQSDGRLDLVLSYPVSRRRLLAERTAVLVGIMTLFAIVISVSAVAAAEIWDVPISVAGTIAPNVMLLLLGTLFGVGALAVGAATLNKSTTIGVVAAVAGGAYLVDALGSVAGWMEPFRPVSPFYWYGWGDTITNGLSPTPVLVLAASTMILYFVADTVLERRDLAG